MDIEYFRNGKKEVTLLFVLKAMFSAQTVFFGYSGYTKWLAGKTGTKDVVGWYVGNNNIMYVAVWCLTEVALVRLLSVYIIV